MKQFTTEPLAGGSGGERAEATRRADYRHFQSRCTFLISSKVKLAVRMTVCHVGAGTLVQGGPASGRHVVGSGKRLERGREGGSKPSVQ